MSEYSQCVRISSTDGKNTVEQFLHELRKKADKGQVEFGVDITVERVTDPEDVDDAG